MLSEWNRQSCRRPRIAGAESTRADSRRSLR